MPRAGAVWVDVLPNMSGFGRQLAREIGEPVAQASRAAGEAGGDEMVGGMREKLKTGGAAVGALLGAAIAASAVKQLEKEKTADRLAAQLGASGKGAERAGKLAGSLYSKAVVGTFEEGAESVRQVMGSGLIPEKATGKAIESLTVKVTDLSTTFEQDLSKTANAAAQMIRTGMAKDGGQALDILTKGFQSSANKADDLLDTMNEYSTQFRRVGIDGKMAIGLIDQAIKGGARDSDQVADAIGQFGELALASEQGVKDAFKSIGLDAGNMADLIGKGGSSATSALQQTLDALRGTEDQTTKLTAATALFGDPGTVMGDALFAMNPASAAASAGMDKTAGAAAKLGKTIRGNTATRLEVLKRRFTDTFGQVVNAVVIPAINGLVYGVEHAGDALQATGDWINKWGAWLLPVIVLVGGLTIALNAQAIATGFVTAVFSAYRAAILVGTAVTSGFAAAQAVLNAVMALNPFVLIAIALVALGVALVVAYKKSETFRNIVQAAFKAVSVAALWLWNVVLKPVVGFIVTAFKWWWTAVKIYATAVGVIFYALGAVAVWLWQKAISPVIGWIVGGFRLWWTGVKLYFGLVKAGFKAVGAGATWLWKVALQPAFRGIASVAKWLYDHGIKPPIDKAKAAAKAFGEAFVSAKDTIGRQFGKVGQLAKKPIAFVINTVYNRGIVGTWNKVAKAFGAPPLKEFHPEGFRLGGILAGQSTYRQGDDQLVPMRRGEGVAVSEAMRDPYERRRLLAVNQAAMHGKSLRPFQGEGFAEGGIFGWVKSTASKGVDLAKEGVGWLKDGLKASAEAGLNAVVKPLIEKISGSSSLYRDMVTGIPKRMIKAIVGYSGKADGKLEAAGIGGKGYKGALSWARTQNGKAYQWGGNGDPSWDCSGFMSAIESVIRGQKAHRRWATGSFSGATAPPGWVRGKRSPFMIGITNSGVGHTAGTLNGTNVESRGGDGVIVGSRARGYRDGLFSDWYGFAAKGYADGGKPRSGEVAWVGESGPELVRFRGGEEVFNHRDSMRMWEGIGARGFAKGTAAAKARKDVPGDLTNFTKSLTGSASDIAKAAKELAKDLKATGGSGKALAVSVTKVSAKLQAMAKQRDAVDSRLEAARSAAADQKKTAADFMGLSNFAEAGSIRDVLDGMRARQSTVATSEARIKSLSKKGLNQDLISQLVAMGPDSQLAGLISGASGGQIKQFNALAKSGAKLSTSYGRTMADSMFDAGDSAAKGFLTGLLRQEAEIQAAMAKLGAAAVKAIRSKKGIDAHSPSRKGEQAGADLGAGLVAGMAAAGPSVVSAAERMASDAVPAGVVPVTSGTAARANSGGLDGRPLYLVVEDGTVLRAYVSDRVDDALDDVHRSKRAGKKG